MDESKNFENGVHHIANDVYHSSHGISRSALMEFKRSPFHYWHRYLNPDNVRGESTPAMVMGNLVHTLTLEPEKFDDEFIVRPDVDRRTNAGKFAYNQWQATLAGRIGVTRDQLDEATAIAGAVRANELANSLLEDCKIEQSIYFTHRHTGIQCKVRPDAWNGSIIVDLKTTNDASFRAFQSSAFKYGYFLQAGMISYALDSIGIKMEKFINLAVEKTAPHAVGLFVLDEEAIVYGETQFDALMESYAKCLEKNSWPGYGLQVLTVPSYAAYEVIEESVE